VTKVAYVVLGINENGIKEVWVGASESAKYWMGVLNELKSRSVQNVLLFSVDVLTAQRRNHGCLSQGKDTEMHHPPDPQQHPFCEL